MKKIILLLTFLFVINTISFAQNRGVARGAEPGELYLRGMWYGIYWGGTPLYDTLRTAVFRLTENGKKLTIQYDADYFADYYTDSCSVMKPDYILADATSGVVYTKFVCLNKEDYDYTQLWVSFDYGKNWIFREENMGSKSYYVANVDGIIYRNGGEISKSDDYGDTWNLLKEQGFPTRSENFYEEYEFYCISGNEIYYLYHTLDYFKNFTTLIIDSKYVFGQIWGIFPDVYRGGLPGEVYLSSMFPYGKQYDTDANFKVSFSADTGHTFRHVYVSEVLTTDSTFPFFMSDREPGVFYILRSYQIEDKDPFGWHTKVCVDYYRDYGETLVDTYCHDLTKDYKNNVGIKPITNDELRINVYPNPTSGQLRITSYELRIDGVEIFDVYGRKVLPPLLRSYGLTILQFSRQEYIL